MMVFEFRTEGREKPIKEGMYVAYVDTEIDIPFAERKILLFLDGIWSYPGSSENFRGHVYAWVGPLPTIELKDL